MNNTRNALERPARRLLASLASSAGPCVLALWALSAQPAQESRIGGVAQQGSDAPTLAETRLAMDKWIETQQILMRERKDWQQGKEILVGRLELVRGEITGLELKIKEAEESLAAATKKREEQLAENARLSEIGTRLATAVTALEAQVKKLLAVTPQPIATRLEALTQRIPEDPATTRIALAERFQNVLGFLNELNKANNEITVAYEVRTLEGGKPAEVQALYLGLAQAYYVSPSGEAGIGRPGESGWTWQSSKAIAGNVLTALEILQGKHTPAFVPLPVTIQ